MPGLLQTPDSSFGSIKFVMALIAECLGTLIFTFAGSATPSGVTSTQTSTATNSSQAANWAPWGNGMTLVIMVYFTANVSGGHLNPAVTAATIVTGHISLLKGLGYILVQLGGACVGILLLTGLVPGADIGMGGAGPGCFKGGTDVTKAQIFGWELVMTFVLVSVVYAVAIGQPSFGVVGPFAVGLSLFAMVFAGSQYTGTAINPARALGPAAVYHCYWDQVWVYALGEFSGGIIAGCMAAPLYGVGSKWLQKLLPWAATKEEVEGGGQTGDKKRDLDAEEGNGEMNGEAMNPAPAKESRKRNNYPKFFQSRPKEDISGMPNSAHARGAPNRPILESHNAAQLADANRPGSHM